MISDDDNDYALTHCFDDWARDQRVIKECSKINHDELEELSPSLL